MIEYHRYAVMLLALLPLPAWAADVVVTDQGGQIGNGKAPILTADKTAPQKPGNSTPTDKWAEFSVTAGGGALSGD